MGIFKFNFWKDTSRYKCKLRNGIKCCSQCVSSEHMLMKDNLNNASMFVGRKSLTSFRNAVRITFFYCKVSCKRKRTVMHPDGISIRLVFRYVCKHYWLTVVWQSVPLTQNHIDHKPYQPCPRVRLTPAMMKSSHDLYSGHGWFIFWCWNNLVMVKVSLTLGWGQCGWDDLVLGLGDHWS